MNRISKSIKFLLRRCLLGGLVLVFGCLEGSCQIVIETCPDNYDHILCEPWIRDLYESNCCICEFESVPINYQIGYYASTSITEEVFYFERVYCCGTEGIDPCRYTFYDCRGQQVEVYMPSSLGGPFGSPESLQEEYFSEFGTNGNIVFPEDQMNTLFDSNLDNFPICNLVDIFDGRMFCDINPAYTVPSVLEFVCGEDGNIYGNSSIAASCFGIESVVPEACDFICDNDGTYDESGITGDSEGQCATLTDEETQPSTNVYPNPVSDVLTIVSDQEVTYTLSNLMGQVVSRGITNQATDLSSLPSAIFHLQIIDRGGHLLLTKRIMKY